MQSLGIVVKTQSLHFIYSILSIVFYSIVLIALDRFSKKGVAGFSKGQVI